MIKIKHKHLTLKCEFEKYDYAHGLGITAVFSNESRPVGMIKFLCDRSDDRYSIVSQLSHQDLIAKLEEALSTNTYDTLLDNMFLWQSEIEKMGHDYLSAIYGNIANAL
jgi:hypothetical protein